MRSSKSAADFVHQLAELTYRLSVITLGVSDLNRSFHFYRDGLGFPTKMTPDGGIVLFATSGTRLFLYPYQKLAKDDHVTSACTSRTQIPCAP